MSMNIFKNYREMLSEADLLLDDDVHDAEDRNTIQSFYNGIETMSEDDAKETGARNIINHLLGYDSLATAQRQIESIYTKGRFLWNIELKNLPPDKAHLRGKWEACVREKFNAAIKNSRRLKPEWKTLAGEITLFGSGHLYFKDNYDWCPVATRPYVARGSGILPEELSHIVITDHMNLVDLKTALRSSEKRKELGHKSYWNDQTLKTLIEMLEGSLSEATKPSVIANHKQTLDENLEEKEMNSASSTILRTQIPVYYFYHRVEDRNGNPTGYDLVILPRITAQQQESIQESSFPVPDYIYDHPEFFKSARHLVHSFFVDCKIGGKTKWHRVMGLGRLNYEPDVETEETFNEAMAGARDNLRRLYAVKTTADWDVLKTWASGGGPTNVLPPGVEIADVGRQPNFQHAMGPLQLLMQLTRKNAATTSVNGLSGGGDTNELEINALERQSRNAEALAARMSDIYETMDALGVEIFRRFLSEDAIPSDPGYNEINLFQKELRREGIPISFLRKMINDQFANVEIRTSRAAGDGNTVKRAMANAALMQRLSLFSAEAQQVILRRVTAEETEDYEFAETVVPYEPSRDTNQVVVATQENDTMDKQGIINYVPPLNKDDLDPIHLDEHMRSMQADLARAKVRPWDQVDLAAFMVKGSHCAQHIQKLSANKANEQLATQYTQQLQKIAKQGQEFANNLNKQNEAAGAPLSQKDQADLQLKDRGLQLKERAQVKLEDHRAAALELSREKAALNGNIQAGQLILQEDGQAHDQMMDRTDRVLSAQDRALEADKRAQERAQGNAEKQTQQPMPNEPTATPV